MTQEAPQHLPVSPPGTAEVICVLGTSSAFGTQITKVSGAILPAPRGTQWPGPFNGAVSPALGFWPLLQRVLTSARHSTPGPRPGRTEARAGARPGKTTGVQEGPFPNWPRRAGGQRKEGKTEPQPWLPRVHHGNPSASPTPSLSGSSVKQA